MMGAPIQITADISSYCRYGFFVITANYPLPKFGRMLHISDIQYQYTTVQITWRMWTLLYAIASSDWLQRYHLQQCNTHQRFCIDCEEWTRFLRFLHDLGLRPHSQLQVKEILSHQTRYVLVAKFHQELLLVAMLVSFYAQLHQSCTP